MMEPKHQTLNVSAHYSHSPNTCWFVKADRMKCRNTTPPLPPHTALPWHSATSSPTYCKTCCDVEHSFTMTCKKPPCTQLYHDTLQKADLPAAKHVTMLNTHVHSFAMTLWKKQTYLLQNTWWTQHPHTQFYHDTLQQAAQPLPWHSARSSPIFCETCRHEQSWHTTRCDKATPTDSPHLKQLL